MESIHERQLRHPALGPDSKIERQHTRVPACVPDWPSRAVCSADGRNVLLRRSRRDGKPDAFDVGGNRVFLRNHGADHRVRRRGADLDVWSDRCDFAWTDRRGVHGADPSAVRGVQEAARRAGGQD